MIHWGIIGAGEVANKNVAPAINAARNAVLHAVYNRSKEKAQVFANHHQATFYWDSVNQMLADPILDAVYIASPNSLHKEHVIAAAKSGKHILCDKPLTTNVADGTEMLEQCIASNVSLGVVFQNRYHPAHLLAREQLSANYLGEIQTASAQLCVGRQRNHWQGWRLDPAIAGSGAIVGQALHPIDILRFIMQSEVVSVHCMTDKNPPERPVDDMSWSLLNFSNGARATVVAGVLAPRSNNDVCIYGSKGKIILRNVLGTQTPGSKQSFELTSDQIQKQVDFTGDTSIGRFTRMIEDFSDSIIQQSTPNLSAMNGLQMVKIANALEESSHTGKLIIL